MKAFFIRLFESYTDQQMRDEIKRRGIDLLEKTYYTPEDVYNDDVLFRRLKEDISSAAPDFVMTVNFWPLIARACDVLQTKYLAWSYDCPQNLALLDDMSYDTNYIFLFDDWEVQDYRKRGIEHVYHLPLAVDTGYWDRQIKKSSSASSVSVGNHDISFIGNMYESTFPGLLQRMDEESRGYYKGITAAQQKVYGYYMIDDLLTDDRLKPVCSLLQTGKNDNDTSYRKRLSYSIGTYITFQDRLMLLKVLSGRHRVDFYTGSVSNAWKHLLDGVNIHGSVSYEKEMPVIFNNSRINLNISLRCIRSGIPLRALDIMGCGGFLLSNYQPELAEYFVNGQDCYMYSSLEEAVNAADYFLSHDKERQEIAANGLNKIKENFTYQNRFDAMFETAGIK